MVCIDKKTGQKCKFNDKTKKLDCAQSVAEKITIPTVTISPVSNEFISIVVLYYIDAERVTFTWVVESILSEFGKG